MSEIRWGYATDKHSESWTGCCLTRDEAIEAGRAEYADDSEEGGCAPFWIHSGHLVPIEAVMPDADDIIETMGERAYDEAGEAAEEYPDVSEAARIELGDFLRGWVEKHAKPDFWVADGVAEFITAHAALESGDAEVGE